MNSPPAIVDAQLYPAALSDQDLADLAFFGVKAAVLVAGDDAPGDSGDEIYERLRGLVVEDAQRLRRAGIAPFSAVGIPGRRIPERGFEALLARLPALFEVGRVVALGTIGLFQGGPREEHALLAQLELAKSLDMPVIVGLPARERPRILRRTLTLLRESEIPPGRVMVGGVDRASFRLVRECDFTAGLMIHPTRLQAEEAVRLIEQQGAGGLVLASGAGSGPSDILALPRTLHLLEVAGISSKIARRVSRDNAIAFFEIDRAAMS